MSHASIGKPIGSQNLPLQQEGAPNYALLVNVAGGAAMDVNVTDRAARLLGIVYGDAGQILQLVPADTLTPGNSLEVAGFNFVYNGVTWDMVREGSVAGSMMVEDTGVHTNPERWLQDNHWEPAAEITIAAAGAPGEQPVGGAVPAGETRRIREITIRHAGSANTVVTLLDVTAGNIKLSIDVTAQSTVTWSSQDGREIAATLQPVIQTSDITGGSTYVSLAGVESA